MKSTFCSKGAQLHFNYILDLLNVLKAKQKHIWAEFGQIYWGKVLQSSLLGFPNIQQTQDQYLPSAYWKGEPYN